MLLRITEDLIVNPEQVASVSWERDDRRPSKLHVTMSNGETHVIRHQPGMLGGVDCYEVEKKLLAAGGEA